MASAYPATAQGATRAARAGAVTGSGQPTICASPHAASAAARPPPDDRRQQPGGAGEPARLASPSAGTARGWPASSASAQQLARRPRPGGWDEDVALARGEEVRHVEARGTAHEAGDPLLEQEARISSASAWLRPPATRTSSPRAYSGRIFRARACASLVGLLARAAESPARTSGISQRGQKRSSGGCSAAQAGQTSAPTRPGRARAAPRARRGSPIDDRPVPPRRRPSAIRHARTTGASGLGERDDQVRPVRVGGQVDVGLGGLGRAARVRVVDADLPALVVELVDVQQRGALELVAVRRRAGVARLGDLARRGRRGR